MIKVFALAPTQKSMKIEYQQNKRDKLLECDILAVVKADDVPISCIMYLRASIQHMAKQGGANEGELFISYTRLNGSCGAFNVEHLTTESINELSEEIMCRWGDWVMFELLESQEKQMEVSI